MDHPSPGLPGRGDELLPGFALAHDVQGHRTQPDCLPDQGRQGVDIQQLADGAQIAKAQLLPRRGHGIGRRGTLPAQGQQPHVLARQALAQHLGEQTALRIHDVRALQPHIPETPPQGEGQGGQPLDLVTGKALGPQIVYIQDQPGIGMPLFVGRRLPAEAVGRHHHIYQLGAKLLHPTEHIPAELQMGADALGGYVAPVAQGGHLLAVRIIDMVFLPGEMAVIPRDVGAGVAQRAQPFQHQLHPVLVKVVTADAHRPLFHAALLFHPYIASLYYTISGGTPSRRARAFGDAPGSGGRVRAFFREGTRFFLVEKSCAKKT